MKTARWLPAMLMLALLLPAAARADQTVQVSGVASIEDGNEAAALLVAKADALRSAIERVMGVEMASRTYIRDELIDDSQLYTSSRGCVRTYKVTSQGRDGDMMRVIMDVTVSDDPARCDGGLVQVLMEFPRLLVVQVGEARGAEGMARAMDTALTGVLADRHFQVVDQATARRLADELSSLLDSEQFNSRAARLALDHDADLVIVLRPLTASTAFDGVSEEASFSAEARVISSSTAQVLAGKRVRGAAVHPGRNEAMLRAGEKAGLAAAGKLIPAVLDWWSSYLSAGVPYEIHFKGPKNAEMLAIEFEEALERVPGVVSLTPIASGGGLSRYSVRYQGRKAKLRRDLVKALVSRPGFKGISTQMGKGRLLVFSVR